MIRSYKYRLYPSHRQAEKLDEMLICFCRLYNAALEHRINAHNKGDSISFYQQCSSLKTIRADDPQYRQFSHTAKQKVLRRLDKAYKAFFLRLKQGEKAGFPRFKPSARWSTAEFAYSDGLRLKGNKLRIVGVSGGISVRLHRDMPEGSKIKAATISRKSGKWHVCFQLEVNDVVPSIPESFVGIDMGLDAFIATNHGEIVKLPKFTKDNERELRRASRSLSRKEKDSNGWKVARAQVQKIHRGIAGRREIFIHSQSKRIADHYDGIALEKLNVKGMAKGTFAKSINNASWSKFAHCLEYKAESAGKSVEFVNPAYTSQTCSTCGHIKKKELSVRMHNCGECGLVLDRDVNAAINILHKSKLWLETNQESLTYQAAECVDSKASNFCGGSLPDKENRLDKADNTH